MRKRQKSTWKERIIHGFLLPLAFMATVLLVVLPFLGYDLFAVATSLTKKPIAYVEKNLTAEATDQSEEDLLEKEIDHKDNEISSLKKQLDEQEIELKKKQSELESLAEEMKSELADKEDREKKLQQLAKTYEGMSASKSASIMENLTLNEAALLLDAMGSTEQAAVLGKMNSTIAADLTIALKDLERAEDPELAAMQERVALLMNAIDRSNSTLSTSDVAKDLSEMPEEEAADILSKMAHSDKEKEVGLSILQELEDDKRKALLAKMEESISSSYVTDLAN
ncbi:MotE family protein [Guptibacillus spartinae]|uniref:MotE family protein n=1 Tax=Guptibacillus spartinae TaxID=3025679 RepID=UPI00235FBAFF|nr:hypothetical protein [Pseudalkalibacillus spartinae]